LMKITPTKNNLKILVVDDEEDTREGCRRILTRMGYGVFTAANGREGLEILEKENTAIVLLDLKMPGVDGMEVLERIQEKAERPLVIVITGYATVETAIKAMKLGAYDFIAKPFDPDALRIVVRRAHEKVELTREAEKLALERRKTLLDLSTEKSRTRTIIESLPTGVVVTNSSGNVVLINPSFKEQLGLDPGRAPGGHVEDYIEDDGFCEMVKKISCGGFNDSRDIPVYEFSPSDGRYLLAKGKPIKSEDDSCIGAVITVSDISVLKALDRLKSEFVAEVSHELRSPLSTIHEQLALVIRDIAEGKSTEDLPILSRALDKTHELISLVGDLLDLSRIEAGTGYSEPKMVKLDELIESVVSFLKTKAEKRKQNLSIKLPDESVPDIFADPLALESIFGNLITNAINYTQEGGKILVKIDILDDRISVAVIDNGIGIEEKYLKKIFDRFYRVKNEKTRFIGGTGLGLPIVKGLVESLGGTIKVESTPGEGSTFTVFLPVAH